MTNNRLKYPAWKKCQIIEFTWYPSNRFLAPVPRETFKQNTFSNPWRFTLAQSTSCHPAKRQTIVTPIVRPSWHHKNLSCSFVDVYQCDQKKSPNVYKSCPKMLSLEKWSILTPLQKLPKNVGDLSKLIVSKGFKKLPKIQ